MGQLLRNLRPSIGSNISRFPGLPRRPIGPPHAPLPASEPRVGVRLWGSVLPRPCFGGSPTAGVADSPFSSGGSLCAPRTFSAAHRPELLSARTGSPNGADGDLPKEPSCRPSADSQCLHCDSVRPSAPGCLCRPVSRRRAAHLQSTRVVLYSSNPSAVAGVS